jgi:serine/threonine-protein kinase
MKTGHDACDPQPLRLLAEDRLPPGEVAKLQEHLEGCRHCRAVLDDLVDSDRWLAVARHRVDTGGPFSDAAVVEAESIFPLLAPSDWPDSLGRLGTYEVKGVLGRGGMGVVFKAFDPALNRNVAIKVMSVALAACGASRQRFLREARAAAAVVHEHVVAVYAVDESGGLPYLVMEYVPGLSLQERIDRLGPRAPAEVLRIGMQTAAGLAAAHAQGLVHRDIKPANILLENGVERVRLTDFGLARAAADAGMTHSGVVAGTPHYMSPEQARGETTDHRADLFSLGTTLYAMCAGHPPFRAETPLAVLRRVIDEPPRPLREINSGVPEWLELIIARLMAKDPACRFSTATEVAEILGRCLAHLQQPLLSPLPQGLEPPQTPPKAARSLRKSRAMLVGSALTAVAIGALAFWAASGASGFLAWLGAKPAAQPAWLYAANARPTWAAAADLDRLIDQGEHGADSLESELMRPRGVMGPDPLSAQSHALAQEAEDLERDILSSRLAPRGIGDYFPNPIPHDRR